MYAAVMRKVGPPSVLQVETDFPKPIRYIHTIHDGVHTGVLELAACRGCTAQAVCCAPLYRRPGEVLIKVAAAGVNPIDFKTRGAQGGVPRWAVTLPKVWMWIVDAMCRSMNTCRGHVPSVCLRDRSALVLYQSVLPSVSHPRSDPCCTCAKTAASSPDLHESTCSGVVCSSCRSQVVTLLVLLRRQTTTARCV